MVNVYQLVRLILFISVIVSFSVNADIIVSDDTGTEIHLAQPANRIISLAPNLTELLFSAGAGEKIVGTVRFSDYPEAAKTISLIGDSYNLDFEAIIKLKPDLIVFWESGTGEQAYQKLTDLGLTVYRSEPDTLEKIATTITQLGQLSGTEQTAILTSEQMLEQIHQLRQQYSQKSRIQVFYQFWDKPVFTVNGQHLISRIIELCGGHNIYSDLSPLTPQINPESVLQLNPEVIITSGMDANPPEWMGFWRNWPNLAANANNHIYSIPPDYIQRHTPRIIQGARMMCEFIDQARPR